MAKLKCYSPGQSPLDFYWEGQDRRRISGRKPTAREVRRYLNGPQGEHFRKAGYQVHKIEGRWTILKEVRRVDEYTLEMKDPDTGKWQRFRYRFLRDVADDREVWANDLRIEFYRDLPDYPNLSGWWELRNLSMCNQITFFVRYEAIWEQTRHNGRPIPDKLTWLPKVHNKANQFPDGDGKTIGE